MIHRDPECSPVIHRDPQWFTEISSDSRISEIPSDPQCFTETRSIQDKALLYMRDHWRSVTFEGCHYIGAPLHLSAVTFERRYLWTPLPWDAVRFGRRYIFDLRFHVTLFTFERRYIWPSLHLDAVTFGRRYILMPLHPMEPS